MRRRPPANQVHPVPQSDAFQIPVKPALRLPHMVAMVANFPDNRASQAPTDSRQPLLGDEAIAGMAMTTQASGTSEYQCLAVFHGSFCVAVCMLQVSRYGPPGCRLLWC